ICNTSDLRLDLYHGVMEAKLSRSSRTRSGRARRRPRTSVHGPVELRGSTRFGKDQKSLPCKDNGALSMIGEKFAYFLPILCTNSQQHGAFPVNSKQPASCWKKGG